MADIVYINADLFSVPVDASIMRVHCVGSDFLMGAGIAAKFPHEIRSALQSLPRRNYTGHCLITGVGGFYTANLVSKPYSAYYPGTRNRCRGDIAALRLCLADLKRQLKPITKELHMPLIGCGLDNLDWKTQVEPAIVETFKDTNITIRVFYLGKRP